ncbi:MAG TPA: hypothetical protein VG167_21170 [Verrucomicrobiae bacterium]|nr:hypothetical protein [Verrucomicrobiae bacterium]
MKKQTLFSLTVLAASSLLAAGATPKDDITTAAQKLGDQPNYSWRTTFVVPEDAQFKPGPADGKTEKEGITWVSMSFFDNKMQAVLKGKKGALTDQDGAWKSVEELEKEEGPGRFGAIIVRNIKTPAKEAARLAAAAKELKLEDNIYSGDLTEEGATAMQTFETGGSEHPTVSDAKGSVKFWVKDGALTKYEFKLKGNIKFGDNEFPNDRTTTVEIKDVGTTKLEVPEEARKKIS